MNAADRVTASFLARVRANMDAARERTAAGHATGSRAAIVARIAAELTRDPTRTNRVIAVIVGASVATVARHRARLAVAPAKRGGPIGSRDPMRDEAIRIAIAAGKRAAVVGRRYGISKQRVAQIVRRAEVDAIITAGLDAVGAP